MKNVALIGFMGSGKSTVAAILAARLHAELSEIDDNIVKLSGRSSVAEIFDKEGEAHFRILEKNALSNVLKRTGQVISCGGGVVSSDEGMKLLKQNAIVVFLHADFETIGERLRNTDSRPLFRDAEKAMTLYAQRLPLYKRYADIEVATDDQSPDEVAEVVLTELKNYAA